MYLKCILCYFVKCCLLPAPDLTFDKLLQCIISSSKPLYKNG